MKKAVLRLVAHNHLSLLRDRLPPAGKPLTHDLEARLTLLIEAIPSGQEPNLGEPSALTHQRVENAIEWLYTSLARSQVDVWPLVAHLVRLDALDNVAEILSSIADPPQTLGHTDIPSPSLTALPQEGGPEGEGSTPLRGSAGKVGGAAGDEVGGT